jgi:hypothetical protein
VLPFGRNALGLFANDPNPRRDGEAQFLAGGPAAGVQDVVLQQAEEPIHRGVVRADADGPIDPTKPLFANARTYFVAWNCGPRSLWTTVPVVQPRRRIAIRSAATARQAFQRDYVTSRRVE